MKTPNIATVCDGTLVNATFNAGTDGVGCADAFEYRFDGGSWVTYNPGDNLNTSGHTSVDIRGQRAGCNASAGCSGTAWVTLASWTMNPQPSITNTILFDTICNSTSTNFALTSNVPGTTFAWTAIEGISFGASDDSGNTIAQTLTLPISYTHYDSAVYRVTPTGPAPTGCIGTAKDFKVYIEPTTKVTASSDTICDNTATSIKLTSVSSPTNPVRFKYTSVADNPAQISGNGSGTGLVINGTISETLDNKSNTKQRVVYTITPYTVDNLGNEKCTGADVTVDIWVEPTPIVTPAFTSDTICDNTATSIKLTSVSSPTNPVRFKYTSVADNPAQISGNGSGTGLVINGTISETLDNKSNTKQRVVYTITPYTVDNLGNEKCTGADVTVDIWVEPTPIVTPAFTSDTICDNTATSIKLTSVSSPTNPVRFKYTSVADNPAQISGNGSGTGLVINGTISETLDNKSNTKQRVVYTITPYTVDNLGNEKCTGADVTVDIWVEPTPIVTPAFTSDTICDNTATSIKLTSVSSPTNPVRFKYTSVADNPAQISGNGSGTGLVNNGTISETLDNKSNTKQRVVYTITPYTVDNLGNEKCTGADVTVDIWVEPTPIVTPAFTSDTICDNTATSIKLTSVSSPTNPVRFKYTSVADNPAQISGNGSGTGLVINGTISETLDNKSNTKQRVVYTITPYTVDNLGNEKCTGADVTVDIWVEPTPIVTPAFTSDTICDNTATSIKLTSVSTPTNPVRFKYTSVADNPAQISGNGSGTGLVINGTISETLDNKSNTKQRVVYTITPYTVDNLGNEKCTGSDVTVDIWVEPTPIVTPAFTSDTICDNTATSIKLTSVSTPTNPVRFKYTSVADNPAQISGNGNSAGLVNNGTISETLDNKSNTKQRVVYTITPYTVDNLGNEKCTGADVTVDIWVEPTPIVTPAFTSDTICDNTATSIKLTSVSSPTNPVRFKYTSVADNPAQISGNGNSAGLVNNGTISETLDNKSNTKQRVVYTITPYTVDNLGNEKCTGADVTVDIWVEPTPIVTPAFTSDTICDNTATSIKLTSVSTPTNPVRFKYTSVADNPAQISGNGNSAGLVNNGTISETLDNKSNTKQRVVYTITPYTVDNLGNEKCTGADVTVDIWVEPTPIVTPAFTSDTICDNTATSIKLTSVSSPTNPVRFKYTSVADNPAQISGNGNSAGLVNNGTISETLDNKSNTKQRVVYTITPYTVDNLGNEKCTGADVTVDIWVEPTPIVTPAFTSDTICDNTATSIKLTSVSTPTNPVRFKYTSVADNPAQISGNGNSAGLVNNGTISETLDNKSNTKQRVVYTITPYTVDNLGNEKCTGADVTVDIWVEPTPIVTPAFTSDTICDNTATSIKLTSVSSPTNPVRFKYTSVADNPAQISGNGNSAGLVNNGTISETLDNKSNTKQRVVYTITPYTVDNLGNEKCTGADVTVDIWVEPTPIVTPAFTSDTICDNTATSIKLTSVSSPTNPVRFKYTSVADNPAQISGNGSGTGLVINGTISETLDNKSNTKQRVVYTITPYTVDNLGNEKCTGADVTVDIWVEPTPIVTPAFTSDTICDNTATSIKLTSVSSPTNPVRFKYTSVADNPAQISGNGSGTGLVINGTISETLDNKSNTKQRVVYTITPYTVDNLGNEKCTGADVTVDIWVEPTPIVTPAFTSDTICDNTATSIKLTSVSSPTNPVRFKYTSVADNPAQISGNGSGTGLVINGTISETLDNKSNTKQRVVYTITPYTVDNLGNEKCTGADVTVDIWVEPTPIVTPAFTSDTICDNTATSIKLTSVSSPTNPVRFKYTSVADNPAQISGNGSGTGLVINGTISETLDNKSNTKQRVVYTITPYTVDNLGNEKCTGSDVTVDIWVEPTPIVTPAFTSDTICDNTATSIKLTSVSSPTNPVRFKYTSVADNPAQISGNGSGTGLVNNGTISETLDNKSNTKQRVVYTITPYTVDNLGNEKCTGADVTVDIWVEPTVTLQINGDTLCNDTYINLKPTSTNITTNGIKFTWTVTNPSGKISGFVDDNLGQSLGYTISRQLHNSDTIVRYVVYQIVPHAVQNNGKLHCAGTPINVTVYVNPTPRINVSLSKGLSNSRDYHLL